MGTFTAHSNVLSDIIAGGICFHVTGVWIYCVLIVMEKTHALLALTEVTLYYIIAAQKRLKRKELEEEKILDLNVGSCIVSNSAACQRSWTPVMLLYLGGVGERRTNKMWMTRVNRFVL